MENESRMGPGERGPRNESCEGAPAAGGRKMNLVRGSVAGRLGNEACVVLVDPLVNQGDTEPNAFGLSFVRFLPNGSRTEPRNGFETFFFSLQILTPSFRASE